LPKFVLLHTFLLRYLLPVVRLMSNNYDVQKRLLPLFLENDVLIYTILCFCLQCIPLVNNYYFNIVPVTIRLEFEQLLVLPQTIVVKARLSTSWQLLYWLLPLEDTSQDRVMIFVEGNNLRLFA